jgi:hypothetical protein
MTAFGDTTFLAAGPASERIRSPTMEFPMATVMAQFYKNYRVWFAYFAMTLIVIAPSLESAFGVTDLRLKILTACPLLLVFLLNDWRTEMITRLGKVEESINNPDPPLYSNFAEVEDRLTKLLQELKAKNKPIHVDVLGVSAKFTWQYFETFLTQILDKPPRDLDLRIRIAVSSPAKLDDWGLTKWSKSCRHNLDTFKDYMETHCETLARHGIQLAIFEYDNLPHWHGVILNNTTLFQGRTEWIRHGDDANWDLRVGEVEYREFHNDDHYGGKGRVERFLMWFNRYLARAEEKACFHSCGFDCRSDHQAAPNSATPSFARSTPRS